LTFHKIKVKSVKTKVEKEKMIHNASRKTDIY
jgi:hypothetical protein